VAVSARSPKIVSVVGARPQFVKVAPIHRELSSRGIEHSIIHSGQHYDDSMSATFFADLGLPEPAINLGAGSGKHADQTAAIIARLDGALMQLHPDVVVIYGDTNTTLAAAVVVAKRSEILVHVEAGLRSNNRRMPEEINRIAADHLSHLLLAPTRTAMAILAHEGLADRSQLVGDVMVDELRFVEDRVRKSPPQMPEGWATSGSYVFATIHRAENTDDESRLRYVLQRLGSMHVDVRLAVHPRLANRMEHFNIASSHSISLWPPLSYPQTIHALRDALAVVTDSGGLQKEAVLLGRPCITARNETEWLETVESGWNVIDPQLTTSIPDWSRMTRRPLAEEVFGDGHAAVRIVDAILQQVGTVYG
jgi:UDP-N-acetylglucosamine 2-epimerase (non-hydrolysing)